MKGQKPGLHRYSLIIPVTKLTAVHTEICSTTVTCLLLRDDVDNDIIMMTRIRVVKIQGTELHFHRLEYQAVWLTTNDFVAVMNCFNLLSLIFLCGVLLCMNCFNVLSLIFLCAVLLCMTCFNVLSLIFLRAVLLKISSLKHHCADTVSHNTSHAWLYSAAILALVVGQELSWLVD